MNRRKNVCMLCTLCVGKWIMDGRVSGRLTVHWLPMEESSYSERVTSWALLALASPQIRVCVSEGSCFVLLSWEVPAGWNASHTFSWTRV